MAKENNKFPYLFSAISLFCVLSFFCLLQLPALAEELAQAADRSSSEIDLESIQQLESKLKSEEEAVSEDDMALSTEEYLARAGKSYTEGLNALQTAEKALDDRNLQEAASFSQSADKHFANVNAMIFRFLGKASQADKPAGE
ncbi:MAG: hypothetical protein WCT05_12570, partial [Lentisphaeria bacterium]